MEENVKETAKKTTRKKEVKIILAEVVNCSKLNIRAAASKQSQVLCVVSAGDILKIEPFNTEWVKAHTSAGISGHCRKEFTRVKE